MVILQNVIKIIVGIIGMIVSGVLMFYFVKVEGKKQNREEVTENIIVDSVNGKNQENDSYTGNNGQGHVYDTMDLTGGGSEDTALLGEEVSEDTSLL